ncbi:DNA primase [[Clostridium] symbiosum]|uniref:DNA primase n=1 Tax=Clostridium symbiosum TaxID=1512 RepID=UPI001D076E21|nr:DNA primase [[Clostridium] symbiosum]MCB6611566.1 DNA primase [[Clostridium] symbiosum]MCB6933594.1 DNA primase [[Clostridium] symbiosum]
MYYPEEVIEEVRMRSDIVDVISGYVKLQKKGANYFGLCPFHHEKSPSFSVAPQKQMYHCFGCGVSGNVITFIMEYENYSFREAVEMLADRSGVKLPKMEYSKEAKAQADLKAALLEINKQAANYFYFQLKQPQGQVGYDYLRRRELTDETILRFGLGYSNKTSDDLYRYLKSKGYDDGILKETGLVTIEERGSRDKFWNRVMFPIMDVNNRVIGFGGRVMGDGEPKYLNSPETRLFDKSRNLYGLNYARTSRQKFILLCEGYMDVISMHQAGFTNAVASLGTAMTEQHAALLKRYTDQVVLTYDSDGAGVKAALRAIPILKNAGISTKVLNMRPYKDPDEFMKNLGPDEFRKRIENARNSFLFEIDVLKEGCNMEDPEQKTDFYNKTARKLLDFPEALERDNYIQAVSREFFINYENLKTLVNQLGSRLGMGAARSRGAEEEEPAPSRTGAPVKKKEKEEGIRKSERLLLTWLIEEPELFDKIKGIITPKDFVKPLYREAAEMVFDGHEKGEVNPAAILNHFIDDEGNYREVAALFNASLDESLNNEEQKKAFSETVLRIKRSSLEHQIRHAAGLEELQKLIREQAELANLHISLD